MKTLIKLNIDLIIDTPVNEDETTAIDAGQALALIASVIEDGYDAHAKAVGEQEDKLRSLTSNSYTGDYAAIDPRGVQYREILKDGRVLAIVDVDAVGENS